MGFVIERAVPAPIEFVHRWWMENGPSLERSVGEGVRQERLSGPPERLTVRRWTTQGDREVFVEARVEIATAASWELEKATAVNGAPFTVETVRYALEPAESGCRLRIAFSIAATGRLRDSLLAISKRRLFTHREREVDRALAELQREFGAWTRP